MARLPGDDDAWNAVFLSGTQDVAPSSSAVWKMDLVKRYPGARDREAGSAVRERMGWIHAAAFSDEVRFTRVVPRWL